MKKNITIVGGGITGCIVALILKKNGHVVKIYEAKPKIGGILNDYHDKDNLFFQGCQYLNLNNDWFDECYDYFKNDIDIFDHTYGSYVELNDKKFYSSNFACPVFENINLDKLSKSSKIHFSNGSLSSRLNFYPTEISNFLLNLSKKNSINPDEVASFNAINLHFERITSLNQIDQIHNLKKSNVNSENLLAVQRKKIYKKPLLGALPKNGYDSFFAKLAHTLKQLGIEVNTNSPVNPIWNNNKLEIINKSKQKIQTDLVIWTGNPTYLIKSFSSKDLDSIKWKIYQVNYNLNNTIDDPKYFTVFSESTPISKIYIYKIDGVSKISIEYYQSNHSTGEIKQKTLDILRNFKFNVSIDNQSYNKKVQTRYNIISLNDKKIIEKFFFDTNNTNLVSSPWLQYGRDKKIGGILNHLKQKNLIKL